jgi:hypothetical protein
MQNIGNAYATGVGSAIDDPRDARIAPQIGNGATMSPVTVQVQLDELRELITAAQECADDLQNEIERQYPSRLDQPVQMRRFCRDMAIVERARRSIQAVDVKLHEPVYRYE